MQKDVQVTVVGKVFKAKLQGIEIRYLTKKETSGTSKTCHRCRCIARKINGRIYKCQNCGMEYDRDLNACVNIAHRVTSSMGWGSREPPKPADVTGGVKPQVNTGSSLTSVGSSSHVLFLLNLRGMLR